MCDLKITPELIVALFALVVAIMSYLHAKSSSKDSHDQIEELKNGQKKLYETYSNHLKEEEREKEAREKGLAEAMENSRKQMDEFFKREQIW